MVIVIDFDGTLALGDTSNINTMTLNIKLAYMINKMYDDGNIIKIVTARGSKTCKTILEKEEKYRNIITNWLITNNVKFNELSFNKEYGDAYIDDRCYNITDDIEYEKLDSKFTTNKVRRINNCVIKNSDEVKNEYEWYSKAIEIGLEVPKVLSYDKDTISTNYINGVNCDNVDLLINTLRKFKNTKPTNKVNFNSYIERIEKHIKNNDLIKNGDKLINKLNEINPSNTFNHGDFSVHNQIMYDNKLYLIDPIYSEDIYQSYIIDAAKHLYSILYYNLDATFFNLCYNEYMINLDIKDKELDILIACESIRVSNRKRQLTDITNNLIDVL